VIKPGDLIARIVPTDRELIAEVRIDPKDAGHIHVGADADIRLATYDKRHLRSGPGKVEYLSATTFSPGGTIDVARSKLGEPYYKATIRLLQDHVELRRHHLSDYSRNGAAGARQDGFQVDHSIHVSSPSSTPWKWHSPSDSSLALVGPDR